MAPASLHGCLAPAKLNLFLHITGRRPDGYHLLQTVFQLLDHGDTLDFTVRADGAIHRVTDMPGVPVEQDLTVRALGLLQGAYRTRHGRPAPGIDVAIHKILPMGGGLGGGSSDAATAFIAANHLWQAGFTRDELMALALPLGADVPFFIFGETAFAEGVGEAMQAVTGPDVWFVVIEPGVAVPTQAIFSAAGLTRNTKAVTISDFSRHLTGSMGLTGFGKNDLQAVAVSLFPPVAQALGWLGKYGEARMTGSGACVFCACASEAEADHVLVEMAGVWQGWKARSLKQHPLKSLLQNGCVVE
ncbi:MAG: 4-(cytidine 5'-diphospho)-2-C-methyl-D-erythritol kinase [Pseudomonadota bacterium]|nr:4-(cytidine 5'-diphospho)-2-C-methyl-D-erythritol kinase [Pseudomonadota bacterium]